jgi:hypothetical protein
MYWIKPDPETEKRYHEAMDRVYKLWKIRDALPTEEHGHPTREEMMNFGNGEAPANASERYRQAQRASHEAYEAAQEIQQNYFRLNIFAMGHYVDVMRTFDMVVDVSDERRYPHAPWKNEPNESELWDTYYEWENGEFTDGDVVDRWKFVEYSHELEAYLANSPDSAENRIPTYKFGTNDGWIVTPVECRAAVERARSHTDDEVRAAFSAVYHTATVERLDEAVSYWHKWIKFIEGAAEHEGFEVR